MILSAAVTDLVHAADKVREHGNAAAQDSVHIGDRCPVIGHRDSLGDCPADPALHLAAVQHTASAVDDEGKGGEIFGKTCSGGCLDRELFPRAGLQPAGDLDSPYIVALSVMGASLRDQNPVAVPEPVDLRRPQDSGLQEALIAGHEYGEGSERNTVRHVLLHRGKSLAVCDNHGGRIAQAVYGRLYIVLLNTDGSTAGVENVPDDLLLGQDQPSLGGCLVDGNDQDHLVSLLEKIRDQTRLCALSRLPFAVDIRDPFLGADTDALYPGDGRRLETAR